MICIDKAFLPYFFSGIGFFISILFAVIAYYAKKYHLYLEKSYFYKSQLDSLKHTHKQQIKHSSENTFHSIQDTPKTKEQ